jgi:hypothetical protein
MAEEYKLNWDIPDYGFNPQEEAPAFDFGADVDWGLTDTSNWGMLDDSWDMFQPLEEEQPWLNPDFNFEEEWGAPSLYDDPYTTDAYGNTWNMEAPSWNDYGNILDEGWGIDQDWSLPGPSLRELLGEEVNYASGLDPNDPMYEHDLGLLSQYGIGSGMDQYYGDQYGDAWRSPWAIGDDPLAGFNFDAEGNITAPEFSWFPSGEESGIETLVGPEEEAATEGGRNRPVLDALAGIFGLGPAGPNAAGVTGRRRPHSPFSGGMSVTPEWMKRIGDRIGLGGRSGLQDAYVTGYPEGTGQGIFSGGDGLGSLFGGGGDGGFNLGNLVLPGILGMAAYKAAKEEDLGVPLSPSVTMDPLGRYQLARELGEATADDRGIFGLGKAPASLDFTTMGTPEAAESYPVAPIQTPFPDNPYYEEGFPPGFTYQPVLGGE